MKKGYTTMTKLTASILYSFIIVAAYIVVIFISDYFFKDSPTIKFLSTAFIFCFLYGGIVTIGKSKSKKEEDDQDG